MRTNSNAYRDKIRPYILGAVYDYTGPDTDADRARHIWARFLSEYNYPDNRRRTPNLQARVAEWLSGLPLNIAYTNADILALAEEWHGETVEGDRADRIVENWFSHAAFHLLKAWEAAGIDPHRPELQGARVWD